MVYPAANGGPFRPQNNFNNRQQPLQSPPLQQGMFNGGYGPPSSKPGRGGARNQVNNPTNLQSRVPNTNGNSARIAPIQTTGHFDYMPVAYYPDPQMLNIIMTQLDYYFSIDNLCKDLFLRKQMDTQGFVFLPVICNFRRMRELTNDVMAIRAACAELPSIEFVVGDDGYERVRRREGWEKFVLPMDSRDGPARSDGPSFIMPRSHLHPLSQPYSAPILPSGYSAASPPVFPGSNGQPFSAYPHDGHVGHPMNGDMNGHAFMADTQLSAAVPEFSPGGSGHLSNNLDGPVNGPNGEVEHFRADPSRHDMDPHHGITSPSTGHFSGAPVDMPMPMQNGDLPSHQQVNGVQHGNDGRALQC
jgi:la-related protein 1